MQNSFDSLMRVAISCAKRFCFLLKSTNASALRVERAFLAAPPQEAIAEIAKHSLAEKFCT